MMQYPYFINPAVEALPSATGEERIGLLRLISANVGDEATLRALIGVDPAEFANFYPDMTPPQLSTEDTISGFISRFSGSKAPATTEVEQIIAAPAIDYASMLVSEENEFETDSPETGNDTPADSTSDVISSFLAAVPPKTPAPRKTVAEQSKTTVPTAREKSVNASPAHEEPAEQPSADNQRTSDPDLSMELFKLMVKNKNYNKALEIITELSLNNPKKSIYFAYQMRFLRKLIKNQEISLKNR